MVLPNEQTYNSTAQIDEPTIAQMSTIFCNNDEMTMDMSMQSKVGSKSMVFGPQAHLKFQNTELKEGPSAGQ